MRVSDALGQIAHIHQHVARAEVYRGFRPQCVALSGILGLIAGAFQSRVVAADDPAAFVRYWLAIAAICGSVGVSATVAAYFWRDDDFARRRTRQVAGQFLPCVVAGVATTVLLPRAGGDAVAILPGAWAMLFSLGVFAARPYLPHATGWVGLLYLTGGTALLALRPADSVRAGWAIGGLFAVGQLATAWVLHRNEERANA